MLKSTKRFILSNEALNNQGFRVRTAGIDLADFYKNPIMLFMHERPKGLSTNEVLPLGYWDDLELKDNVLYGTPVFDDTDEFAKKIYNKVENGTLKMASAGLAPRDWDTITDELWLEKSKGVEFSIVDRGSNPESLSASAVVLYDKADKLITLSDINQIVNIQKHQEMKLVQLSADTMGILKLADGATPADAHTAVEALVTLADKQKGELATLKTAKEDAEAAEQKAVKDLADAVKLQAEEKLILLVDTAVQEGKITADQKPDFIKLSYEVAEPILNKMPKNPSISSQIETEKEKSQDADFVKLSYLELDRAGKLVQLKAENLELFKSKFKEQYKTEYTG